MNLGERITQIRDAPYPATLPQIYLVAMYDENGKVNMMAMNAYESKEAAVKEAEMLVGMRHFGWTRKRNVWENEDGSKIAVIQKSIRG